MKELKDNWMELNRSMNVIKKELEDVEMSFEKSIKIYNEFKDIAEAMRNLESDIEK